MKTYIDSFRKWELLTATIQTICNLQFLHLYGKDFWLTIEGNNQKVNKSTFWDKLSLYKGNLIHWSKFSRQPVTLSVALFHLMDSLRQAVWGKYFNW